MEAVLCAAPLAHARLTRRVPGLRSGLRVLQCKGCAQGQGPEEALPPGGDAGAQGDGALMVADDIVGMTAGSRS